MNLSISDQMLGSFFGFLFFVLGWLITSKLPIFIKKIYKKIKEKKTYERLIRLLNDPLSERDVIDLILIFKNEIDRKAFQKKFGLILSLFYPTVAEEVPYSESQLIYWYKDENPSSLQVKMVNSEFSVDISYKLFFILDYGKDKSYVKYKPGENLDVLTNFKSYLKSKL